MKDVYADPDEEVADGGQHKKLLEDEVVDGKHEGEGHCELVYFFILFCEFVVAFFGDDLVSFVEDGEHAHADQSLSQSEQADEQ